MSQPLDVAYVVIAANTDPAEKEIQDFVKGELRDLEKEVDKTTKKIDKDFERSGKNIGNVFDTLVKKMRDAAFNISDNFGHTFLNIETGIRRTVDRAGDSFSRLRGFGDNLGDFFSRRVFPLFERAGDAIGDFGKTIGNTLSGIFTSISQNFNFMAVAIGAVILALPALIGLLVTLGAVLANVSSLVITLPAFLSVLAAAIAPVVIGFQNFGTALGAIMDGDPEKIEEALSKLAGPAREVAREFADILPRWRQLQRSVQSSLFAPLVGDLTRLSNVLVGPLDKGLSSIALIIGNIISDFAALASSPLGLETFNAIFETTASILTTFRNAFRDTFGPTLFKLIQATLPVVNKLMEKFFGWLEKLSGKLNTAIDDGSFNAFLDEALESLQGLMDLSGSIIDFFGALFTPTTLAAGQQILEVFTQLFTFMAAFLQTQEGQQFLEDLATDAVFFAKALAGLVLIVAEIIRWITGLTAVTLDFFNMADRTIVKVTEFGEAVGSAGGEIVRIIGSIPGTLMGFADSFANAGFNLIKSFFAGFGSAGGFIADVASDIVGAIKNNLNKFIGTINSGINALDILLPGSLARIPSLAEGGVALPQPGGQLVRVAEAGQAEAIVPLDEFFKRFDDDGEGGGVTINFGANAVNVSFSGVVPTEQEARSTGEAVGSGIAQALARHDLRETARAL